MKKRKFNKQLKKIYSMNICFAHRLMLLDILYNNKNLRTISWMLNRMIKFK